MNNEVGYYMSKFPKSRNLRTQICGTSLYMLYTSYLPKLFNLDFEYVVFTEEKYIVI